MKTSTKAAAGAGMLTAAIGITAAFLCPAAGLVAGAYFTYGAVTAAGMGLGATVALTAAGAVGGLWLGRVAAPIVAAVSVGLGAAAAVGVKLFGALIEKITGTGKSPEAAVRRAVDVDMQSSFKGQMKLAARFARAKNPKPANGNAPAQKLQKRYGFNL